MRSYFCGWYFKCQNDRQTLAVIPAVHQEKGKKSCSIQFITEEGAWNIELPDAEYRERKDRFRIQAGESCFGREGIRLCVRTAGFSAQGAVRFGEFSPIRYDIMGPFCCLPFLECRHSVVSMRHTVTGELCVNGVPYCFQDGVGYIEGDRGRSFPREYAWTQCSFPGGSLMLSVADVPLGLFHFTGVIGVILWQGREYRLATYLGAKAVQMEGGRITVRQGTMVLSARLIEKNAHPLRAPVSGAMSRTIHESASCRAAYRFVQNGQTLFQFETAAASFEYEFFA